MSRYGANAFKTKGLATPAKLVLLALLVLLTNQFGMARQADQENWNWDAFGGHADESQYVPLHQINKANVSQLQVAWTYPTQDHLSYLFNPVEVNGVVYVLAKDTSLVALDAGTGKELWVHGGMQGLSQRGISYWQSKDGTDRRLIFTMHNQLQEIDARTGKSITDFGDNGFVDLRPGLQRPVDEVARIQSGTAGQVFEDLIIEGAATGEQFLSPPGDVRAYNVLTGKLVWQFHSIPRPGDPGYDSWPKDAWKYAGGADPWAGMSIDQQRGIVYLSTGGPKYELWGGDRKGKNLFSDALVALDARTGKYLWAFQAVHHDVWDYDMVSAPQLVTIHHDGAEVPVVAAAGKTCFLYVLNRVTGQPIWPIEERPVPQSHVPGEQTYPTQPFPTAPPPFCKQSYTAADINPFLPEEQQKQLADRIASDLNGPIFTPPELQETIEMPGNRGGSNWGTTSSNPDTGMVYVLSINAPALLQMSSEQPNSTGFGEILSSKSTTGETPGKVAFQQNCQACHGANLEGNGAIPSLVGVVNKIGPDAVRSQIQNGAGQMPAFASLSDTEVAELISYLQNPATGGQAPTANLGFGRGRGGSAAPAQLGGDVVGWGGVPAGEEAYKKTQTTTAPRYGMMDGPPYPDGIQEPKRYFTGWNVNYDIIGPPWSTLTAYDLNTGTIKWQVSVGTPPGLMLEQRGAIVTASGLVFLATGDGKVRAYDADTGKILWTGDLPAGSRGIPAMYQWNGREYLLISATSPVQKPGVFSAASMGLGGGGGNAAQDIQRAYVAYALPSSSEATK